MALLRTAGLKHARLGGQVIPDLRLDAGQHLLVLGASGSGKTTLTQLLCGWLTPVSGEVFVAGLSLKDLSAPMRHAWCAAHIGVVTHSAPMLSPLTVQENLRVVQGFAQRARANCARAGLALAHAVPDARLHAKHTVQLLEQLDLVDCAARKPASLSQGQFQRAAMARALAHSPSILLADEPTSHLDDRNCERTLALLTRLAADFSLALLVVTHDRRVKETLPGQVLVLEGAP
jgi:putative ABC transport system ATP-binding protein